MLNNIIRIDLHIHSVVSGYKEVSNIINQSTIENLSVLFSKLQDNNISMFSITDHNRFDSNLYIKAKNFIDINSYPKVKEILAGVEFDVKLEKNQKSCHIITIFNANGNSDAYKKIEEKINANLLVNKEDSYSKKDFEILLKSIGLDVILIANQRKDLNNGVGYHHSLNDSTNNPYDFLKIGYINALEYQKPNVQGILNNCLKDFDKVIPLISGSDCHEWSVYPCHDKSQQKQKMYYSKIKTLPSFKGLMMAITSPKTRFDRIKTENINFLKGVSINDKIISFDSGINAIIGENGSGKTTIIKAITKDTKEHHVKTLIKENNISIINDIDLIKAKIIGQSEIIKKFNDGTLFSDEDSDLFKKIDHSIFEKKIYDYSEKLFQYLDRKVKLESSFKELENYSVIIESSYKDSTYYIDASSPQAFTDIDNRHETRASNLNKILNLLKDESENKYYKEKNKKSLKELIERINEIYISVNLRSVKVKQEIRLRNIIIRKIDDYRSTILEKSTSQDKERSEHNKQRKTLIDKVVAFIKNKNSKYKIPIFPSPIRGNSINETNGFVFQKKSKYNNLSLEKNFFLSMFNQKYSDTTKIDLIKTEGDLCQSIKGANRDNYKNKWGENLKKFTDTYKKEDKFIKEASSKISIGNTMGEISIVYYKYQTFSNNDWELLIIDQPEDNISNNKISSELIKYLNNLRLNSSKQIIFVTHSPLLVVNLDVDNVIFLKKNNNIITAVSGCLEDDKNNILNLIAEYMDGGKDMIEKRLNLYGKSY